MMRGCSEISLLIRVSVDSSSSMERPPLVVELMGVLLEEEEEGGGVRLSCTTSLEQLLRLCIAKRKTKGAFFVLVVNVNEGKQVG